MQDRKTSSTDLQKTYRSGAGQAAQAASSRNAGPNISGQVVPFDPLDEFVFSVQDPNAATRDNIADAARNVFGSGPENSDFISKLVEHMLSVSESRSKVVAELVILGGHLQQMMKMAITQHTGKVGNTMQAQRKAAQLCFDFFQAALGITRASARSYIRCHQKFGDNAEAVRIFSFGELNLLASRDVTEEQIESILNEKKEALKSPDGKMTRNDVQQLLKQLRRREEEAEDQAREMEKLHELLQDNKTQLDVSERESQHLKEQLASYERQAAEKENSIANLRLALTERAAGYPAMEQELADKNRKLEALTAELVALTSAPPKIEKVEVPVEKLPDGYQNLKDAIDAALSEISETQAKKDTLLSELNGIQSKIDSLQAEFDAGTAVSKSLDELTVAWSEVGGKMSTFQLAVQASSDPDQYNPVLQALAATLRKYVHEIEAALSRKR